MVADQWGMLSLFASQGSGTNSAQHGIMDSGSQAACLSYLPDPQTDLNGIAGLKYLYLSE